MLVGVGEILAAKPPGQLGYYVVVLPGLAWRVKRSSTELTPPFGVCVRAGFLREGSSWENHISQPGCLGQENILHDKQVQLFELGLGVVEVRLGEHRVLAHNIQPADILAHRLNHIRNGHADLLVHRSGVGAPGLGEFFPHALLCNRLIAAENIWQRAHIAGALDIGLASQRVHSAAGETQVAGYHREVGYGSDIVHAMSVLRDAHGKIYRASA